MQKNEVGIDEAGRGPLAGAVFAAAVVLPDKVPHELAGLNDSKKLREEQREVLYPLIKKHALAWAVAQSSVLEIEKHNILGASLLAMRRAFEMLSFKPAKALVDGNRDPKLGIPTELIVKGDSKVPAISAASILAKVDRDRYMRELHLKYPVYGFDGHKGYAAQSHREAILKHGPCPEHRKLFLRNLLGQQELGL